MSEEEWTRLGPSELLTSLSGKTPGQTARALMSWVDERLEPLGRGVVYQVFGRTESGADVGLLPEQVPDIDLLLREASNRVDSLNEYAIVSLLSSTLPVRAWESRKSFVPLARARLMAILGDGARVADIMRGLE